MTHLTRDELVGWRDAPNPADRDRIILHLAGCDECGALYADLMRTRPATAGPETLEPAAFIEAGAKAGPVRHRVVSLPRILVPLAAAAIVIFGVTTLLKREPASFRGADHEVTLAAPSGTIDSGEVSFRWTATPDTPAQRLLIYALDDPSQPVVDVKNVA